MMRDLKRHLDYKYLLFGNWHKKTLDYSQYDLRPYQSLILWNLNLWSSDLLVMAECNVKCSLRPLVVLDEMFERFENSENSLK